jgi:hypothetical protein
MTPQTSYELTVKSMVIRGEKANKGLEAQEAANQHQMNRIRGFLTDGTAVMVAQRPGKGGMDFNKLMGGKVYAVAADGISPVFEKDGNGKATKTQKIEDGLPLYSSSGFYLLSSKEYPALELLDGYTLLRQKGALLILVTEAQLAAHSRAEMTSELDWDLLAMELEAALGDEFNLVAKFDEGTNRRRMRGIERARQEAEDADETYGGVDFKELSVSKKDGNACIVYAWTSSSGAKAAGILMRQADSEVDGRVVTRYFTAEEAMTAFAASAEYAQLNKEFDAGHTVTFGWAQGHTMRTSVSFRRKAENVLAAPADKPQYGDAVYIQAALKNWTRGLLSVMQSQHPNFPQADYDAHHYVVASRQAEVGMNKSGERWTSPQALTYSMAARLLA